MGKRVGLTYRNRNKVEPYEQALRIAGVEPLLIDPNSELKIEALDGLLLTGGTDVNPSLYHQDRHPETDEPDDARDTMEKQLLESALERDIPILAICRGLQLLNVVHGGTLVQHIEGHRYPGTLDAHTITVEPGAKLARAIGGGTQQVNSRHHQAVDQVGASLRVTAKSADGCIEALERVDRDFVVAVQWHPEDLVNSHTAARKLFRAFAKAL